jgi:hypothetical protein
MRYRRISVDIGAAYLLKGWRRETASEGMTVQTAHTVVVSVPPKRPYGAAVP